MEDYRRVGVFDYDQDREIFEDNLKEAITSSDNYDLQEVSTELGAGRKVIEAYQPSRPVDSWLGNLGLRTWPANIRYEVSDADVDVKVKHRSETLGEKLEPEDRAEDLLHEALEP